MHAFFRALCALVAAAAFAGAAHAADLSGVWTGTYVCTQGQTGLELTIQARGSRLQAVFEFGATPDNAGVPDGAFHMSGGYRERSGSVRLDAGAWINQPDGYEIVHLDGAYSVQHGIDVIEGNVLFPALPGGCTRFRVERRPAYVS